MDAIRRPWGMRQPPVGTRPRAPWVSFDGRHDGKQSSWTIVSSMHRAGGPYGSAYRGTGAAGIYCTTSVNHASVATDDSTAIACVFSATSSSAGALVTLGRSANATGGYLMLDYSVSVLRATADDATQSVGALTSTSSSVSHADGRLHSAVVLLQNSGGSKTIKLFVDGRQVNSASTSGWVSTTYDRFGVCMLRRSASGSHAASGQIVYDAWFAKGITDAEALDASRSLWDRLNAPRRIFVPVSAATGSYTLTAESGTYTLTGQAAGLLTTRTLPAEQGSYTLTGQDAGLYVGRVVTAEQGSYTLNGQDATLTYTPAGAYSLTAGQGSYTLTGQDVTLLATRALQAEQGTYTITGQAANLLRGLALSAEAGTYTLTGQDAAFARTYALAAAYGAYALTGQAVTLTYSGTVTVTLSAAPIGHGPAQASRGHVYVARRGGQGMRTR